jgi:hypothetical protein
MTRVPVTADPRAILATPENTRWEPLTPQQVGERLRGLEIPWWIAGGWALDLFLGRQTRAHNDIEIAIFRDDLDKLRAHLRGWECFIAETGTLTPLGDKEPLPPTAHEIWSREKKRETWQLEILIEERQGARWTYRRDAVVGALAKDIGRFSNEGIPYIRPDIQLLYKSKGARASDEADLITVLPRLDPAQRATLSAWLWTTDPGHRWLERLK